MAWRLTFGEQSWSEDDVTVADAVIVSELLEADTWRLMEPNASPRACVAWLSVLLARAGGVSIEEAQLAVMALPFRQLVDALTIE
jgi:hypothetical protein